MVAPAIGVLALQGAFAAHAAILEPLGINTIEVRTSEQLASVDGLVMPGGESTTMSMLLERSGMLEPLRTRLADGLPAFGTCAGLILLASEIRDGRDDQHALGVLDMTVLRNGYGTQLDSFEADIDVVGLESEFHAVFIRAPMIERLGGGIEVLATVGEAAVLCRRGPVVVAAFHPELSGDDRLHRQWLANNGFLSENCLNDT